MGKLHDQMLVEMQLRNYSEKTIDAYIGHMKAYTRLFDRSPAEMGEGEIRRYLYYLKTEKKVSTSSISQAYAALKLFYTKILNRTWNIDKIPRPKQEKKLPIVLSLKEVQKLFDVTDNLKHCVILMTIYSAGLRVSEAAHLQLTDIDSTRMTIRVEQGKGNKDRYTILSKALLPELRAYYKVYRPESWLFPGSEVDRPVSTTTIQRLFQKAKKKPVFASLPLSIPCATVLPPTF
jgi:site-specific recombinase XerD